MDGYAVGIDIGTTSTKAVLLGPGNRLVAESPRAEHTTVVLSDRHVVVVGGFSGSPNAPHAEPTSFVFSPRPQPPVPVIDAAEDGAESSAPGSP